MEQKARGVGWFGIWEGYDSAHGGKGDRVTLSSTGLNYRRLPQIAASLRQFVAILYEFAAAFRLILTNFEWNFEHSAKMKISRGALNQRVPPSPDAHCSIGLSLGRSPRLYTCIT